MNTEDFVTYKQALALKKLGFEENVGYYYSELIRLVRTKNLGNFNDVKFRDILVSAPTLAQAQKWLREEKEMDVLVYNCFSGYLWEISKANENRGTIIKKYDYKGEHEDSGKWLSYEKALSAGITECLKLLEK